QGRSGARSLHRHRREHRPVPVASSSALIGWLAAAAYPRRVGVELVHIRYDDAVVRELTAEVQAEYGRLYGGSGDSSPMDPEQFAPPQGFFLLALVDGEPVGM